MPDDFNTSFIPKKSAEETRTLVRRAPVGWFMSIAVLLFVLALLSAIGVFAYTQVLKGSVARKQAQLEDFRSSFEASLIEELARLDKRLTIAQDVIDNHVAVSKLLAEIEDNTIISVQFTKFSFAMNDDMVDLSMEGEARNFESVALQSDVFGESSAIQDPIFSNLHVLQNGNVGFSFSGAIDPSLLTYTADVANVTIPEDVSPAGGGETTEGEVPLPADTGTSTPDEPTA